MGNIKERCGIRWKGVTIELMSRRELVSALETVVRHNQWLRGRKTITVCGVAFSAMTYKACYP